ncbi:MAG TPA: cytochrome c peroxidase [Steroidobacteraceae bacterium]|nr:cytochrome c peroxidase [Steroidobacteraceae bacterium]
MPGKLQVRRFRPGIGALLGAVWLTGATLLAPGSARTQEVNPHPYIPHVPRTRPLSAMALLGERLFHDPRLSGSGRLSCASCHDPAHAFGPPGDRSVVLGGARGETPGFRAVPSLRYLYRQPPFTIGPDLENGTEPIASLQQQAEQASRQPLAVKTALAPQASVVNLVPQGGLFWDGRANTLQQQVDGPLFNPAEMDAGTPAAVLAKLAKYYGPDFEALFGPHLFENRRLALDEALFAIGRYQIEGREFHPFSSKFDAWLAGQARFTAAESRGYRAFNTADKGNCAACHIDQPTRDGRPPLFTDFQYEALGVPRNPSIPANRDPAYYDLGICGPYRTDLAHETRYCGMFLTPTLRNVAVRRVFFHNGVFHSLRQVLDWYVNRDLAPQRFYSRDTAGRVVKFDDLPAKYRANVDTVDGPFNRHPGDPPALSAADIDDVIAFLATLTDGYAP